MVIELGYVINKITPEVSAQLARFIGERKALCLNFSDSSRYILIVLDTLVVFKELLTKIDGNIESAAEITRDKFFIFTRHTKSGRKGLGSISIPLIECNSEFKINGETILTIHANKNIRETNLSGIETIVDKVEEQVQNNDLDLVDICFYHLRSDFFQMILKSYIIYYLN